MKTLLSLTLILLCIGCNSKTGNNTKTEIVDSLTLEEYTKKFLDSTFKARDDIKAKLGYILPEWKKDLDYKMSNLSTAEPMQEVQTIYSYLELSATIWAWNKQLEEQGYDISDTFLKEDSIDQRDMEKKQHRYFQNMRLLFTTACKEKFWIDDIDVKVSGSRNQYIHFIASQFVYNRNIKEFDDKFGSTFYVLRFAQVRYSYSEHGKYTYFEKYKGKDSDPIPTILGGGFYSWGTFPNSF